VVLCIDALVVCILSLIIYISMLGICRLESDVVFDEDMACMNYSDYTVKLSKVTDIEPLYCTSCDDILLSKDEYKEHEKDKVYSEFFIDECVYEESYAGD